MPTYNSAFYLKDSINSVLKQTFEDWELIIVDDGSIDSSVSIINNYLSDKRIRLIALERNYGTAYARQIAINNSFGSFIAFLDSDDMWHQNKLSYQLDFMIRNNYLFTYTTYTPFNNNIYYRKLKFSKKKNYEGILIHSPGNSTVLINSDICKKISIPDIKKRNDYLYFLKIIKETKFAYLLNENLTFYRLNPSGISNNKLSLLKYHWKIYRHIEKLNFFYSVYIICIDVIRKTLSLLYTKL
jgi:teichuronic acid biosynthesis glycosyltransferase TuaG